MGDFDIYFKRLNRYGTDYPSRLQNQREREFERKLTYSVYRLDFPYGDTMEAGTLEPLSQDNTKTMAHLLTRTRVQLEPGTILMLDDVNNQKLLGWYTILNILKQVVIIVTPLYE